jgi:uncharacterized oligopeptide transporter (OPT) family protein
MFIGAFIALMLEKKLPKIADKYIIPLSSGIIAGESIMGVFIALSDAKEMVKELFLNLFRSSK